MTDGDTLPAPGVEAFRAARTDVLARIDGTAPAEFQSESVPLRFVAGTSCRRIDASQIAFAKILTPPRAIKMPLIKNRRRVMTIE